MTRSPKSRYPQGPDLRGVQTAHILPILDPDRDHEYFDPRSEYSETFWLPILGPSTMWLMRKVAERFDHEPEGFELDLLDASLALGIASRGGRNNAFHRALTRAINFHMGRTIDDHTIGFRRFMPPLHQGQINRLSPRLQRRHSQTIELLPRTQAEDLARAHKISSTLLELGDSPDVVEQQLTTWGLGANVAKEAVDAAWRDRARDQSNWSSSWTPAVNH